MSACGTSLCSTHATTVQDALKNGLKVWAQQSSTDTGRLTPLYILCGDELPVHALIPLKHTNWTL